MGGDNRGADSHQVEAGIIAGVQKSAGSKPRQVRAAQLLIMMNQKLRSGRKTPSGRRFLPLHEESRDDLVSQDTIQSLSPAWGSQFFGSNELGINAESTANLLFTKILVALGQQTPGPAKRLYFQF